MKKNNKLTACSACNNNVSKKAKTCPHCGQMDPAKKGVKLSRKLLFIIIFFIFILGLLNTDYTKIGNKLSTTDKTLIKKSVVK